MYIWKFPPGSTYTAPTAYTGASTPPIVSVGGSSSGVSASYYSVDFSFSPSVPVGTSGIIQLSLIGASTTFLNLYEMMIT